jgi:hypothetical protein
MKMREVTSVPRGNKTRRSTAQPFPAPEGRMRISPPMEASDDPYQNVFCAELMRVFMLALGIASRKA